MVHCTDAVPRSCNRVQGVLCAQTVTHLGTRKNEKHFTWSLWPESHKEEQPWLGNSLILYPKGKLAPLPSAVPLYRQGTVPQPPFNNYISEFEVLNSKTRHRSMTVTSSKAVLLSIKKKKNQQHKTFNLKLYLVENFQKTICLNICGITLTTYSLKTIPVLLRYNPVSYCTLYLLLSSWQRGCTALLLQSHQRRSPH